MGAFLLITEKTVFLKILIFLQNETFFKSFLYRWAEEKGLIINNYLFSRKKKI